MDYEHLSLPGLVLFKPSRHADARGFFAETFRQSFFWRAIGKDITFVQENQSYSKFAGTIRGLHFQAPPRAQAKLVQCVKGALTDVVVDIRKGSPSFGGHLTVGLSEDNGYQLWIPEGFLHGLITRREETVIQYKCTDYFNPDSDATVLWNDKDLNIGWETGDLKPIISKKDELAPTFAALDSPFSYETEA